MFARLLITTGKKCQLVFQFVKITKKQVEVHFKSLNNLCTLSAQASAATS